MNKKILLTIILIITIFIIIIIFMTNKGNNYNKLVISNDKWQNIIKERKINSNLKIDSITFNYNSLLIDEDNSIIYYSVVDTSNKYNPYVSYTLNNKKIKMAFNNTLSDDLLEDNSSLKVIIYDDSTYHIYNLVLTKYPLLNINYKDENIKNKVDVELELFDNYINSTKRLIKSNGKLKIINDNEYRFSLKKESLGKNQRNNYISIFGMEKQKEYILKKTNLNSQDNEKYVRFFINNKYIGLFSIEPNKERSVDIYEQNKENNK